MVNLKSMDAFYIQNKAPYIPFSRKLLKQFHLSHQPDTIKMSYFLTLWEKKVGLAQLQCHKLGQAFSPDIRRWGRWPWGPPRAAGRVSRWRGQSQRRGWVLPAPPGPRSTAPVSEWEPADSEGRPGGTGGRLQGVWTAGEEKKRRSGETQEAKNVTILDLVVSFWCEVMKRQQSLSSDDTQCVQGVVLSIWSVNTALHYSSHSATSGCIVLMTFVMATTF